MSSDHTLLRGGTRIFSWGRGDLGQLGTELDLSQLQPVLVQAVDDKDITHVAASVFNSAFITGEKAVLQACMNMYKPVQHCSPPCSCMQPMPSYGRLAAMTAAS